MDLSSMYFSLIINCPFLMFKRLLKWTVFLDFDLSKIVKTVVPMHCPYAAMFGHYVRIVDI